MESGCGGPPTGLGGKDERLLLESQSARHGQRPLRRLQSPEHRGGIGIDSDGTDTGPGLRRFQDRPAFGGHNALADPDRAGSQVDSFQRSAQTSPLRMPVAAINRSIAPKLRRALRPWRSASRTSSRFGARTSLRSSSAQVGSSVSAIGFGQHAAAPLSSESAGPMHQGPDLADAGLGQPVGLQTTKVLLDVVRAEGCQPLLADGAVDVLHPHVLVTSDGRGGEVLPAVVLPSLRWRR